MFESLETDPTKASLLALAIVDAGATDRWANWLASTIEMRALPADSVNYMARPGWLDRVSDDVFLRLLRALHDDVPEPAIHVVIDLLADRLDTKKSRIVPESLYDLAERAIAVYAANPVGGMADYYWEKVTAALVSRGRVVPVAAAAVAALSRRGVGDDHFWKALHLAADADPEAAWRTITAVLEQRGEASGYLMIAFSFHRRSFPWPTTTVLQWVGDDERRARAVATIVRPFGPRLSPILAGLIVKFGASSSVADVIAAKMHSTDGVVSSLAANDAARLVEVREWSGSGEPEIDVFARRLLDSLTRSHEAHASYEEHEKRRWGT